MLNSFQKYIFTNHLYFLRTVINPFILWIIWFFYCLISCSSFYIIFIFLYIFILYILIPCLMCRQGSPSSEPPNSIDCLFSLAFCLLCRCHLISCNPICQFKDYLLCYWNPFFKGFFPTVSKFLVSFWGLWFILNWVVYRKIFSLVLLHVKDSSKSVHRDL